MNRRKKSKKRKDMMWYNPRLYCSNKKQKSAIEKLVDAIYPQLDIEKPHYNTKKKKMALNVIISNVYQGFIVDKFVAFPLYRGYYTTLTNQNPVYNTYQYIVCGIKALINFKYLEHKPHHYHYLYPDDNTVSGIKASKKLIDAINEYTEPVNVVQNYFDSGEVYTYTFSTDELVNYDYRQVVELKDASPEKKLMDYRPNKTSLDSKKFLGAYNSFMLGFDVKIPMNKVNPTKYPLLKYYPANTTITNQQSEYTTNMTVPLIGFWQINSVLYKKLAVVIKRVFNNGVFTEGGRYYGAEYQFLSEEERSWITIDDEPVVEIDYKTFHPRILYHKKGIDIKGDLYLMANPEVELRPAIKKMMNMMINTKTDFRAVKAFEKELLEDEKGGEIQTAMIKHRVDVWDLTRMIHTAHKPIEKYFKTSIGVEIQYEDSELAKSILIHFMNKKIPCLVVHDSFLVQEKYKDELYEVMMTEYEKMFDFKPELEINERKETI
jgi:hypothetical protein